MYELQTPWSHKCKVCDSLCISDHSLSHTPNLTETKYVHLKHLLSWKLNKNELSSKFYFKITLPKGRKQSDDIFYDHTPRAPNWSIMISKSIKTPQNPSKLEATIIYYFPLIQEHFYIERGHGQQMLIAQPPFHSVISVYMLVYTQSLHFCKNTLPVSLLGKRALKNILCWKSQKPMKYIH